MEAKKETSAATEVGKSNTKLHVDKRCNRLQSRVGELIDTIEIHLHATYESALAESRVRIRNL